MMMYANDFNELLETVKKAKKDLKGEEIWFRGQGNSNYKLLPSLLRNKSHIGKEEEVFRLYKKISQKVSAKRISDWETLFDMQHYFAPTRLLDWSENLGVSLFFAVKNCDFDSDVALYLLDPIKLNEHSKKDYIPIVPDDCDGMNYLDNYIKQKPYPASFPIALRPNFINERLTAQRGAFTIHGIDTRPIEEICPDAVKKIIIKRCAFPSIEEFLEIANINEYTIFPDMRGVANYIRDKLLR